MINERNWLLVKNPKFHIFLFQICRILIRIYNDLTKRYTTHLPGRQQDPAHTKQYYSDLALSIIFFTPPHQKETVLQNSEPAAAQDADLK